MGNAKRGFGVGVLLIEKHRRADKELSKAVVARSHLQGEGNTIRRRGIIKKFSVEIADLFFRDKMNSNLITSNAEVSKRRYNKTLYLRCSYRQISLTIEDVDVQLFDRCFRKACDALFLLVPLAEFAEAIDALKALEYATLSSSREGFSKAWMSRHGYYPILGMKRSVSPQFVCSRKPLARLSFLGPVFSPATFGRRGLRALRSAFLLILTIVGVLRLKTAL